MEQLQDLLQTIRLFISEWDEMQLASDNSILHIWTPAHPLHILP